MMQCVGSTRSQLIKDGYHCTLCVNLITCVNKDVIDFVIDYLQDTFKTIIVQHDNSRSYLGMDIVFTDDKAEGIYRSTVTTL
jgi:hypothetical protein